MPGASSVSDTTARHDIALFGRPRRGASRGRLLHRARVTESSTDGLTYVFSNSRLVLGSTSGAPILDANGTVVAINVSGWKDGGELRGHGNPLSGLRAAFEDVERRP